MQPREVPPAAEPFPLESEFPTEVSMEPALADALDEFPSEHDVLRDSVPSASKRTGERTRTILHVAIHGIALVVLLASVLIVVLLFVASPERETARVADGTPTAARGSQESATRPQPEAAPPTTPARTSQESTTRPQLEAALPTAPARASQESAPRPQSEAPRSTAPARALQESATRSQPEAAPPTAPARASQESATRPRPGAPPSTGVRQRDVPRLSERVPHAPADDDHGAAIPKPLIRSIDVAHRSAYSPAFSARGTSLFFHEGRNGATSLLEATLRADDSPVRISLLMRDGSSNYHVQPSPDESRIAFDSDREGVRGVYVAGPNGEHALRISGAGYAAVPRWSPDGTRLVFIRAEQRRPKVWNLWTFDVRAHTLARLTSHSVGQPWGGSWFPDSRRIAYSYEDRLVILDTLSGQQRVFTSPLRRRLIRTPAVSPDGGRIVFQVFRDGIWALDVRRGSMRRILNDRTAEEFAWSPDGRVVAYHSRRNGEWGIWALAGRAIS